MERTLTESVIAEQLRSDVHPNTLPVQPGTWMSLRGMGVDPSQGHYEFLYPGTHIWQSFFLRWGWWKTKVLGFYPYTELRDYQLHEEQGIGRPWLYRLEEKHQEMIFRELMLLISAWNGMVRQQYRIQFTSEEELPEWVHRWLSLTNESFLRGASELDRAVIDCLPENAHIDSATQFVDSYKLSTTTWRPMMPQRAVYHQRYGTRAEYWTFER